jgi:hypothetical protein
MAWDLVDTGWFCESYCGVVASEGDFNVSVFKQVGNFAYVWRRLGLPTCYFQRSWGVGGVV